MSSKRVYYLLVSALVLVGVLGAAAVYFGNQLLASSAQNLNEAKLNMEVIDEQQSSLNQARQDIEKYSPLEIIAKTVVPQEKDQARTVREIVKFAADTDVPVTSITFPTSQLGITQAGKTKATTTDPALSQVTPVEGITGVYQLEITVSNDAKNQATYENLINFLDKLEQNRRTSQVTSVTLQPDVTNRNLLTYSMTINVYIKP